MIRNFLAALTFLTVIPVPGFIASEKEIEACKRYFFTVGLLTGLLTWLVAHGLLAIFPQPVAAVATVIFMVLLSKGFHLDGLADTADGFMSSRPRERIMEIMHDSHIGTMGVLAIVAVLGLQITALATGSPNVMPPAAGLAAFGGRCAMVFYIGGSRYARETGLGQIMFRKKSIFDYLLTGIIWGIAAWLTFRYRGLIGIAIILIFLLFWIFYTKHKIGGATGDTIGAGETFAETLTLLTLVIPCKLF